MIWGGVEGARSARCHEPQPGTYGASVVNILAGGLSCLTLSADAARSEIASVSVPRWLSLSAD